MLVGISRSAQLEQRKDSRRRGRGAPRPLVCTAGEKVRGPASTPAWIDHKETPPSILPSPLAKPCKMDLKECAPGGTTAGKDASGKRAQEDVRPTGTSETGITTDSFTFFLSFPLVC